MEGPPVPWSVTGYVTYSLCWKHGLSQKLMDKKLGKMKHNKKWTSLDYISMT